MSASSMSDWFAANAKAFADIRQHIHQHSELGFEEFQTSDLVAEHLQAWGYEVERGIGRTGLVARMQLGSSERRLGIRAEMDALPLTEVTGLPYASRSPGVMHACGHDGHTTMLLFAAQYIAEQRRFDGTLNLIFQPAEERFSGALRMIEENLFVRYPCDAVFAMHNLPGMLAGQMAFCEGAPMASSDTVIITLRGRGGHGAMPHLACDPTVVAASIILALQTVVSRNADPSQALVITIGMMHAGTACNVIPETARLELTVRALDPATRDMAQRRLTDLVQAHAQSFGVRAEIDYQRGYPVLINAKHPTDIARTVARAALGENNVIHQGPPIMASEDFAFMLEQVPGCHAFIGNGIGSKQGGCSMHNPRYDFNDSLLSVGECIGLSCWICLTAKSWAGRSRRTRLLIWSSTRRQWRGSGAGRHWERCTIWTRPSSLP